MEGSSQKRRGPYLQFLSNPTRGIPKSTFYEWKKKKTSATEELVAVESDVEVEISEARDFPAPSTSTLTTSSEDSDFPVLESTVLPIISDSESTSSEFDVEDSDVSSVTFSPDQDAAIPSEEGEEQIDKPILEEDSMEHDVNVLTDDIYDLDSDEEMNQDNNEVDHEESSFIAEEERHPLYRGAPITLGASLLLVMTFAVRHGLSGVALTDLLILIELHCIAPNLCKTSMKLLRGFFKRIRCPIELHYYCTFCFHYIGREKGQYCPNAQCLKDLSLQKNCSYFIVIPLATQLCSLLARPEIPQLLQYRMERTKKQNANIEDVFDGNLYKKHFNGRGFFHGTQDDCMQTELHLSFQVNTDGVAIFRSSKFSLWPIYFTINELPPDSRFSRKNKLFAGLWFGTSKPDFRTFLEPFANTLKEVFHKGIQAQLSSGESKTVKCILLSGTFDAPAKCLFQNLVQYNGYFGCPYCLSPGTTLKTTSQGHSHTYPFNREMNGQTEQRTHKQTVSFAIEAERLKKIGKSNTEVTKGVKGLSWPMYFPKFDIIHGTAVDYMHNVLLGVVKTLLALWTDKSHSSEPWYLGPDKIKIFERRFLSIKPPYKITRTPRSIITNMAHLKASELRSFLLFYGLPCLWGLLANEYFQHFLLLVDVVFILLQDSIAPEQLTKSASLLHHFCLKMESLYGKRYETFNVHCLLHLVPCVENLGPLWAFSCFWYEDYNGDLRNLFHGTQNVEFQISFAICFQQKIPELIPLLQFGSSQLEYYNHLVSVKPKMLENKKETITDKSCAVGAQTLKSLTGEKKRAVEATLGEVNRVYTFKRLVYCGTMIHSQEYKVVTRRNSYTVSYQSGVDCSSVRYGWILSFLKCFITCKNPVFCNSTCSCKTPRFLALIHQFEQAEAIELSADRYTNAKASHIIPFCKNSGRLISVPVENLISLCITVDCGMDTFFICKFPNSIEKD